MHTCEVCSAKVSELRRGRCWGCYARWVDARPVGAGARCVTCGEQRRRVMKLVELFGNWSPMCFNCAGQIGKLDPMPPTLPELRDALSRERRRVDRRIGRPDTRVFPRERRVGERRGTAEGLGLGLGLLGEDPIIEVVIDVDPDPNPDEITRIRAFAD